MVEHSMLFSSPMVIALLRDAAPKTQTRRIVTAHNSLVDGAGMGTARWKAMQFDWSRCYVDQGPSPAGNPGPYFHVPSRREPNDETWHRVYPRVQPGHALWGRESGWERPALSDRQLREGADTWPPFEYDAQPLMCWEDGELKRLGWKRRPGIHMPRWACRLVLPVSQVRAQRLHDIDGLDAMAEGLVDLGIDGQRWHWLADAKAGYFAPWRAYRALWQLINGAGSWAENPPVWAYTFTRKGGAA